MAEKHIANVEATWRAVCTPPDWCIVGDEPIPFDSYRDLSHELVASPNVNARGTPVYRLSDWVKGTDSNAGKGVVSGTSGMPGDVQFIADNTTVRVNGKTCMRHESIVLMNNGNTVGIVETDETLPVVVVSAKKLPCNDPPVSSPELDRLNKLKEKLAFSDPSQLDAIVNFKETHEILDSGIAAIDIKDEGGWSTVGNIGAQITRGALGFVKDIALGLGQLAYTVGKYGNPIGMLHMNLNSLILAENIKLGNICLESLKEAAKAAGHELAKPVTDAWEKGNYVEAVTRAGLEIASLLLAVGDVAKLGQAAKVAGFCRSKQCW